MIALVLIKATGKNMIEHVTLTYYKDMMYFIRGQYTLTLTPPSPPPV